MYAIYLGSAIHHLNVITVHVIYTGLINATLGKYVRWLQMALLNWIL